jgi:hypothetical protein
MGQTLTLVLDDEVYAEIERRARSRGTTAARWLAAALQRSDVLLQRLGSSDLSADTAERQAARERFEQHFGELDLGYPTGVENEQIDADLARAYSDTYGSV